MQNLSAVTELPALYRYDPSDIRCEAWQFAVLLARRQYDCLARKCNYGGDRDDIAQVARMVVVALAESKPKSQRDLLPEPEIKAAVLKAVKAEFYTPRIDDEATAARDRNRVDNGLLPGSKRLMQHQNPGGIIDPASVVDEGLWRTDEDDEAAEAAARRLTYAANHFRERVEAVLGGGRTELLWRSVVLGESDAEIAAETSKRWKQRVTPARIAADVAAAKRVAGERLAPTVVADYIRELRGRR